MFGYDSFGNLRSTQGVGADSTGGDFRFQGQWLESATGIYHFRARDYDSRTGTFLSRDPVDIIPTEPESFNPYQFVYNNPYVYSDPTGMFSITEVTAGLETQKVLEGIQSYVANQARQYLIDQARGVVGNLLQSALKPLMPDLWMGKLLDNPQYFNDRGTLLETFIRDQVCKFFGGPQVSDSLFNRLWLGAEVDTGGHPKSSGFNCSNPNGEFIENFNPKYPNPDFIFKKGSPDTTDGKPKAWLIGDIKASLGTLRGKIVGNDTQWQAIYNYANYKNNHQFSPLTFFMVLNSKGAVEGTEAELQAEALKRNVFMFILNIQD